MKIKALIPLGALLIASALAVSGMSNGWRRDDFIVTFDDCGGLLSDVNLSGFVYSYEHSIKFEDRLKISFDLNGGESAAAVVSNSDDEVRDMYYYGVPGPDGDTNLSLCWRLSLPNDAVLSDRNVNYDKDGRAIMPDNEHAILYSDRVGYELYLTDFRQENSIELGGVNILKADDKDGFRVMLTPARTVVYDADRMSATYLFSSDPKFYHYEPATLLQSFNFGELVDDNLAYVESVDDGIVWFVDPVTHNVRRRGADGKVADIRSLDADREIRALVGEKDTVAVATVDAENIYLSVNGSQEYAIKRSDNVWIDIDISNGAATFRVHRSSGSAVSLSYVVMDENGFVTEWKTSLTDNGIGSIYINTPGRIFDTYFDGEKVYILENSCYYLGSAINCFDSERDENYGKFCGAMTGYFIRVSILGRDGVIAERLAPLKVNVSRGVSGQQHVKLKIGGRS